MNKISKKGLGIALCFLIPFEALSTDKTTTHAVDNPSHIATTQLTRTNETEKNQSENAHPSRSKKIIKGCLLTAGAFFAAFCALNPLNSSKPSKKKRITNAGLYNGMGICFCNALLQLLYSNISFRKFIDEINLDDLSKYDFSYEFHISKTHKDWPAVHLDDLNKKSDGTISDYNKDASKKQALFKRKVELFRQLFELMDKKDVVPQSFMRDFVYVTLTDYPRNWQDIRDCFFDFLTDIVCLYCQYYDISSPKCIKGVFPAELCPPSALEKRTAAQFFASDISLFDSKYLKNPASHFVNEEKQIVPLFGQFTIFPGIQGILLFPDNAPNNSPSAGYEFKHTDGNIYVLTAIGVYGGGHYWAYKRESDGTWYKYDDQRVSPISWSKIKEAIETKDLDSCGCRGGLMYTFTEKEVFEQSMRETAQSSDENRKM